MRFKWVPEPPESLAAVEAAQQAIPLVPASEADCLRRLTDRTEFIGDRDTARRWLTFLRALDLIDDVGGGYRRRREDLPAAGLADRLLDRIYGARELYDLMDAADQPLSAEGLDAEAAIELPTWERHHQGPDHERVRRRRQRRLADWFVLCGVADHTADGYLIRG